MLKLVLAATLVSGTAGAVSAADHMYRVGTDAMHIYYRDLDTRTMTGRAELLRRVERAATRLCRGQLGSDYRQCVSDTIHDTASRPEGVAVAAALVERGQSELASR